MSTYCPLPFRHVFIEARGIKPCCSYSGHKMFYPGSVQQWIDSPRLRSIQENIRQGQLDPGCRACVQDEIKDKTSTRLNAIQDYGQIELATQIDYVDYRVNNICNFRCRSCEPTFSNGIAQEARRYPDLQKFYRVPIHKVASTQTQDKQWVLDNLYQIRKLQFSGGEPTRIPEVREIIDQIRHLRLRDISIMITSNASFTDPYWFEISKEMPNIHWTLSVDSVGRAAEIIRDGTDWSVVSNTVERLFDTAPSVNIGTVVTTLNLTQLGRLFSWANDLRERYAHRPNGRTQLIEICNWPRYLNPYNWADHRRQDILDFLHGLNARADLQPKQQLIIDTLLTNITDSVFDADLWSEFESYNNMLDHNRNQDHSWLLDVNTASQD